MVGRWVALLRGVNVGRSNRLPMAGLRTTCESIGLSDVRTYIQSGNIVFDTDHDRDESDLGCALRAAMVARHGLDVPVMVRSRHDWRRIADAHPDADTDVDPKLLHVMVLDRLPAEGSVAAIDPAGFAPDSWTLAGREVYVTYPNGSARSKLTIDVVERALGVVATGRNLNTVRKLRAMLEP